MTARTGTECGPLNGWEQVADVAAGRVLLFGEWHGTNEMPEAYYRYVCHVVRAGGSVLVGLELDARRDDALQAGFASDDPEAVWRAGLEEFDPARYPDGRGSIAILRLLLDLKSLRDEGLPITVRAVAGDGKGNGEPRIDSLPYLQSRRFGEEAHTILEGASDFDHVVYFAGNLHARNVGRQEDDAGPLFDQARFLRLNYIHDGGSARNCQPDNGGCGANSSEPTAVSEEFGEPVAPAIALDNVFSRAFSDHYDGYFYVGRMTPAPPAATVKTDGTPIE